jgi:hypothetical protein
MGSLDVEVSFLIGRLCSRPSATNTEKKTHKSVSLSLSYIGDIFGLLYLYSTTT